MIDVDMGNLNEETVYKAFNVDGNEAEALNDIYLELYKLTGQGAMLKLFKYSLIIRLTVPCGCIVLNLSQT